MINSLHDLEEEQFEGNKNRKTLVKEMKNNETPYEDFYSSLLLKNEKALSYKVTFIVRFTCC